MNLHQLKLLTLFLLFSHTLIGQKIDKANTLYRKGLYAAAIKEYKEALKKKKNPAALSHLADCYRILNKAEESAAIYAQIVANNTAKDKDLFNYGNVMMMRGKYDSAKYFFQKYVDNNPDDAKALQSIKACENIKDLAPSYEKVWVEPFAFNTDADETAPFFFQNKLLYSSDRGQGKKIMKKSNQATGREYYAIWGAHTADSIVFEEPQLYSTKLNNLNENTGNVSVTANGKEIFFCRNNDEPSKGGAFNIQLYTATKGDGHTWHDVEKVSFCSNEINYLYPSVSPDGKLLFYVTDKGGGYGGLDLYVATRTKKGWSKPQNLGSDVNSPAHESFPFAAADGKLYFCSKGHIGYGGFDIFVTEKDSLTGEWKKPKNLGSPFNSAYDDISICFKDSISGAFTSPRSGRGDDIFFFKILNAKDSIPQNAEIITDEKNEETDIAEDSLAAGNLSSLDILAKNLEDTANLKNDKVFVLDNIQFEKDSILNTVELDKLASILNVHKNIVFEIGYHTEGGLSEAKMLSQNRANAIIDYLIQKGINPKHLLAIGYGDAQPLKNCQKEPCSPEELQRNKRIEIKIKDIL